MNVQTTVAVIRQRGWLPAAAAVPIAALLIATALFAVGSTPAAARTNNVLGAPPITWLGGGTIGVQGIAVSPDGQTLATAGGDNTVKLWRVSDHRLIRTLVGHVSTVSSVAFSPDGQSVASGGDEALGSSSGHVKLWRVSDGALVRSVTAGSPNGGLAISPDRQLVAVPGAGTAVNLYSTVDGTLLRTAHATSATVSSLSFSGDGTLLAAGEEAFGNNVEIFRVADATLVRTLAGDPFGFVQGVAFAPNGTTLASASGFSRVIQLWDPTTGVLRAEFDQETGAGPFPSLPVAYSPDSSQLGYGRGDATVVVARP